MSSLPSAPVFSIVVFCAPIPTLRQVSIDRTVGNLPLLPYSSMIASAFLWVVYGILKSEPKIWSANGKIPLLQSNVDARASEVFLTKKVCVIMNRRRACLGHLLLLNIHPFLAEKVSNVARKHLAAFSGNVFADGHYDYPGIRSSHNESS